MRPLTTTTTDVVRMAQRGFATMPTITGPWLDDQQRLCNFTDNTFQPVASSSSNNNDDDDTAYVVRNPATQEVLGTVPETSEAEFEDILRKAQDAYNEWSRVPVQQRQRIMMRYQHLIREHTDALVQTIVAENGKTAADAAGDVFRGLEVVETASAAVATHMQGQSLRGLSSDVDCVSYRRPLGVVAGLCPFNFPAVRNFLVFMGVRARIPLL